MIAGQNVKFKEKCETHVCIRAEVVTSYRLYRSLIPEAVFNCLLIVLENTYYEESSIVLFYVIST